MIIPNVSHARHDDIITTDVTCTFEVGVFQSHGKISAFDGELNIHIHTSSGHYFNWHVVVVMPDSTIEHFSSDRRKRSVKLLTVNTTQSMFDAIDKYLSGWEGNWWSNARAEIAKWMNVEVSMAETHGGAA